MPRYLECPKLQVHVSPEVMYLARQAATQSGFPSTSEWVRDRLARLLAAELEGETYEGIMEDMPKTWRENPGAIKLSGKSDNKSGV